MAMCGSFELSGKHPQSTSEVPPEAIRGKGDSRQRGPLQLCSLVSLGSKCLSPGATLFLSLVPPASTGAENTMCRSSTPHSLIYSFFLLLKKKNYKQQLLWGWVWTDLLGRGMRELSSMIVMFCILTGVWIAQLYASVITHWLVHLRSVHFIACKFYSKWKKTISKYWTWISEL